MFKEVLPEKLKRNSSVASLLKRGARLVLVGLTLSGAAADSGGGGAVATSSGISSGTSAASSGISSVVNQDNNSTNKNKNALNKVTTTIDSTASILGNVAGSVTASGNDSVSDILGAFGCLASIVEGISTSIDVQSFTEPLGFFRAFGNMVYSARCLSTTISSEFKPDGKSISDLSQGQYSYPADTDIITVPSFIMDTSFTPGGAYVYGADSEDIFPPYNRDAGRQTGSCLLQFKRNTLSSFNTIGTAGTDLIGKVEANAASTALLYLAGPTGRMLMLTGFMIPNPTNYNTYCAEAVPSSTFFNPQIRIRAQTCNAIVCLPSSQVLNAKNGECYTALSPLLGPTTRFCARIAIPRLVTTNGSLQLSPDPGYYFHFLDTNGFPRPDPGLPSSVDAQELDENMRVFLPKVCLYEDPDYTITLAAALNPWYRSQTVDSEDVDASHMPWHLDDTSPGTTGSTNNNPFSYISNLSGDGTSTGNKVVESSFFFSKLTFDTLFFPFDISKINVFNPAEAGTSTETYVSGNEYYNPGGFAAYTVLNYPIDMRWNSSDQNDYINWVNDFVYSRDSHTVSSTTSLGCVYLPIGPKPPPFCPQPPPLQAILSLESICAQQITSSDPTHVSLQSSTSSKPCVISTTRNNFIYNSARLSIDEIVPICSGSQNVIKGDYCATIYSGAIGTLTSSVIHSTYHDLLPVCSNLNNPASSTSIPCVITKLSCQEDGCRILYSYQSDLNSTTQTLYGYPTDATGGECGSVSAKYPCSGVAGINIGPYTDMSIDLSTTSNVNYSNGYTKSSSSSSLSYNGNAFDSTVTTTLTADLYVSYVGASGGNGSIITSDANPISLDGNQICAAYGSGTTGQSGLINCVDRAPQLPIYSTGGSTSATGTFLNPCMSLTLGFLVPPTSPVGTALAWASSSPTMASIPTDHVTQTVCLAPPAKAATAPSSGWNTDGSSALQPSTNNIIGYVVSTIATDDSLILPGSNGYSTPLAYPTSPSNQIFGVYKPIPGSTIVGAVGEAPGVVWPVLSSDYKTPDTNARYLVGIEYLKTGYNRGGTLMSAYSGTSIASCPATQNGTPTSPTNTDYSMCVLTRLNNGDVVDCALFQANLLVPCTSDNFKSGCTTNALSLCAGNTAPNNQTSVAMTCSPSPCTPTTYTNINVQGGGMITYYQYTDSTGATAYCYTLPASLTMPVCQPSTRPEDTQIPTYSGDTTSPITYTPSDVMIGGYYDITTSAPSLSYCAPRASDTYFNTIKCGVRTKTPLEYGAVVSVPQPADCSRIGGASAGSGYATWSYTPSGGSAGDIPVGQDATGICANGYTNPPGGLGIRTCYLDSNNNSTLEAITASTTCVLSGCAAITDLTAANGFATWTSADEGGYATGTCCEGCLPPLHQEAPAQRKCTNGSLEEIGTTTFCGVPICDPITTADSTNATWTWSMPGSTSTGTCATGYQPPAGQTSVTRACELVNGASTFAAADDTNTCVESPTCQATTWQPDTPTENSCLTTGQSPGCGTSTEASFPTTQVGQTATGTCQMIDLGVDVTTCGTVQQGDGNYNTAPTAYCNSNGEWDFTDTQECVCYNDNSCTGAAGDCGHL